LSLIFQFTNTIDLSTSMTDDVIKMIVQCKALVLRNEGI
jgi:hypothetical protein